MKKFLKNLWASLIIIPVIFASVFIFWGVTAWYGYIVHSFLDHHTFYGVLGLCGLASAISVPLCLIFIYWDDYDV